MSLFLITKESGASFGIVTGINLPADRSAGATYTF
jgi:hypothetical protein